MPKTPEKWVNLFSRKLPGCQSVAMAPVFLPASLCAGVAVLRHNSSFLRRLLCFHPLLHLPILPTILPCSCPQSLSPVTPAGKHLHTVSTSSTSKSLAATASPNLYGNPSSIERSNEGRNIVRMKSSTTVITEYMKRIASYRSALYLKRFGTSEKWKGAKAGIAAGTNAKILVVMMIDQSSDLGPNVCTGHMQLQPSRTRSECGSQQPPPPARRRATRTQRQRCTHSSRPKPHFSKHPTSLSLLDPSFGSASAVCPSPCLLTLAVCQVDGCSFSFGSD